MAIERVQQTVSQQTGADKITTQGKQTQQRSSKQTQQRSQTGSRSGAQTQARTGTQTDVNQQTSQATQAEASEQVETALPYTQRQIQNPNRSRVISTDDIAITVQFTLAYPPGMGTRPKPIVAQG